MDYLSNWLNQGTRENSVSAYLYCCSPKVHYSGWKVVLLKLVHKSAEFYLQLSLSTQPFRIYMVSFKIHINTG